MTRPLTNTQVERLKMKRHYEQAAKAVAKWPQWKREMTQAWLDNSPYLKAPRKPIEND